MTTPSSEPEADPLQALLGELRASDRNLSAPTRVEQTVLAAWDSNAAARVTGRRARPVWVEWRWTAAAASLVLSAVVVGISIVRRADTTGYDSAVSVWEPGWEWLDPDPGSLRVVRVRVPSDTLEVHGLAVDDPSRDGVVDIEMIVGEDGLARSVRVASVE
jgi:hypothetical protein